MDAAGTEFRRELGGSAAASSGDGGLTRLGVRVGVAGGSRRPTRSARRCSRTSGATAFTRTASCACRKRTAVTFITRDAAGEPTYLNYRYASARNLSVAPADVRPGSAPPPPGSSSARARCSCLSCDERPKLSSVMRARRALTSRSTSTPAPASSRPAPRWGRRWRAPRPSRRAREGCPTRTSRTWGAAAGSEEHAPTATWLLTHGAAGVETVGPHGAYVARARKARCVDATGAGDALLAGTLASLIAAGATPDARAWRDADVFRRAVDVGQRIAAKAIGRVGAVAGLTRLEGARGVLAAIRTKSDP